MITNIGPSQEIFAIDLLKAMKSSFAGYDLTANSAVRRALVMSRETSAYSNSVWHEIFVVSFFIEAFLANTGSDWFVGNAAFFCKGLVKTKVVCHLSFVICDWWERDVALFNWSKRTKPGFVFVF